LEQALHNVFRLGADLAAHYRRRRLPKPTGGLREIAEPIGVLRSAQDWLVENVWPKLHVAPVAHGFVVGRSILTHAAVHAPAHTLLTLDVADFFGSIRAEAVVQALVFAGLELRVAVPVARICVLPDGLPQGAPTSPGLANACFSLPDATLTALAITYGARYSRYVDDLAFSWATEPTAEAAVHIFLGTQLILHAHGFRLATAKLRLRGPGQLQLVTGLVINAAEGRPAVRAPRAKWRALRAGVQNAERGVPTDFEALHGLASFLGMTDLERVTPYVERMQVVERWGARAPEEQP
jgi:hypothetical protein